MRGIVQHIKQVLSVCVDYFLTTTEVVKFSIADVASDADCRIFKLLLVDRCHGNAGAPYLGMARIIG